VKLSCVPSPCTKWARVCESAQSKSAQQGCVGKESACWELDFPAWKLDFAPLYDGSPWYSSRSHTYTAQVTLMQRLNTKSIERSSKQKHHTLCAIWKVLNEECRLQYSVLGARGARRYWHWHLGCCLLLLPGCWFLVSAIRYLKPK
jgi:hypothetical protein